jgi:hypothetical protein
MTVFPLAFVVLSLSLLVCAADLYKALQGQTDYLAPHPHTRSLIVPSFGPASFKVCYGPGDSQSI